MLFSNRHLLAAGSGFVLVLSSVAHAQTPAPPGDKKSNEIGTLLDGEAYMFGKDMQIYKSKVKMTYGKHQSRLKKRRPRAASTDRGLSVGRQALHDGEYRPERRGELRRSIHSRSVAAFDR